MGKINKVKLFFSGTLQKQLTGFEFGAVGLINRGENGFGWTKGVQALCIFLLRYKGDNEPTIRGNRPSPAATLSDSLTKETGWLSDLFGSDVNGTPLLTSLVTRENRDFKNVPDGPTALTFKAGKLPRSSIEVYVDEKLIEDGDKIVDIAKEVEKQYWAGREGKRFEDTESADADANTNESHADLPEEIAKHLLSFDTFIADRVRDFVGREFITDAFHAFLHSREIPSGYFLIQGEPGIGKSAYVASMTQSDCGIYHFNIASEQTNTPRHFIGNICAQLVRHFDMPYEKFPDGFEDGSSFLNKLLKEASTALGKDERLVVAVDALDEVDLFSSPKSANLLFLPTVLPEKVFVIVTSREEHLRLHVSNLKVLAFTDYEARNREDAARFIANEAKKEALKGWLKRTRTKTSDFIDGMVEKSCGNFMYLHYVLPEIPNQDDLSLDTLPKGLENYYEDHWRRMGMASPEADGDKLMVIYMLCVSRKPCSTQFVSRVSKIPPAKVQSIMNEWRQYLRTDSRHDENRYGFYHESFRDFLRRNETVKAAGIDLPHINKMLIDYLLGEEDTWVT